MKLVAKYLGIIVVLFGVFPGCSDPVMDVDGDHTWDVSYVLTNNSETSLVFESSGCLTVPQFVVGAQESKVIRHYSWFNGPTPILNRDFWCITLRRESSKEIVAQYSPAASGNWSSVRLAPNTEKYTLTISDEDLGSLTELCFRLMGSVRDAENDTFINGAAVTLDLAEPYGRGRCLTNEYGYYAFWLPRNFQPGTLYFEAEGYEPNEVAFPDSVVQVGKFYLRKDVRLQPR